MINGIHHISMKCTRDEYEKVKSFYKSILDLDVIKESDSCILFSSGNGIIEIFISDEKREAKGIIRHFALSVDNVDYYVNLVSKAGYEVFVQPRDIEIGGDSAFPARIAFCKGPLGEEIEFFCQKW